MARLVVLSFDDNEEAENFVRNSTDVVLALFAKPTVFCTPGDGHRGKKTQSGWTKGKKWGWWVCATCKKPSVMWGKRFQCIVSDSRNLLDDLLNPKEEPLPPLTPSQEISDRWYPR